MEKIKINRFNDPVELNREQVKQFFGCKSRELEAYDAGKTLALSLCIGGDHGAFNLDVVDDKEETGEIWLVTLGDMDILNWIEFNQDEPTAIGRDSFDDLKAAAEDAYLGI